MINSKVTDLFYDFEAVKPSKIGYVFFNFNMNDCLFRQFSAIPIKCVGETHWIKDEDGAKVQQNQISLDLFRILMTVYTRSGNTFQ